MSTELALPILRCATAATLAYLEASQVAIDAPASGFSVVAPLKRDHNYGVVLDEPDVRVLAFRGTDECGDWLTNLKLVPRHTAWGLVHAGFDDATTSFWPEIPRRVREARDAGRRVYFTGHSLGGAIALLAAAKLVERTEGDVDLLCTFGQPAVGGGTFCNRCREAFGDKYIRCVNHTDAVADDASFWRERAGTLW